LADAFAVQKLLELARQELSRIVSVKRSDDANRLGRVAAELRVQDGNHAPDLRECLRLASHEPNELEARVVVHDDKSVSEAADSAGLERAHDVHVEQSTDMRRFVDVGGGVSLPSGVGGGTVRARGSRQLSDADWEVACHAREAREEIRREVKAVVKVGSQHLGRQGDQMGDGGRPPEFSVSKVWFCRSESAMRRRV
jgi:hypothetical protein